MKLGYIGLGKMGFNMVERLLEKKHDVAVYDRNGDAVRSIIAKGARGAASLRALADMLPPPRLVWIMVPHEAVDVVLRELTPLLARGDVVVDGGNSPYKETMRRSAELELQGLQLLDAGVSGGPTGARSGACIMVGGKQELFRKHEQLFRDLAADDAVAYMGPSGAGHFVKMVHNGIEYGMMQALAEGFTVLHQSPFGLDLARIAALYNHRSVIESRLVAWLENALARQGAALEGVSGSVAQSGEGVWTVETAKELGIPVPIIEGALEARLQSQQRPSYTGRILSALRHEFGGHGMEEKPRKAS